MAANVDTTEQVGKPIGRMTSRSELIPIASGTTMGTVWLDAKLYAGGIVEMPDGHTGTLYVNESDNESGLSGGRLGDNTGADVTITDTVGGRPYTFPDAVFPVHYITLEVSPAAPNDLNYKVRMKG